MQERGWEGWVNLAGGELHERGQGEGELRDFGLQIVVLGLAGGEHSFGVWGCHCLGFRAE